MSEKISETKKMFKTEKEITLSSGEKMVVKKLKAGKFYNAQKIYSDWFSVILDVLSKNDEFDLKSITNEDGTANEDRIKEILENNKPQNKQLNQFKLIKEIYSKNDEISSKKLELLSICLDTSREQIEETYYQEDIELLLNTAVELNGFSENLKNSVAPMVNLGATK